MADKQVNININYKVNTVEVEKAQALVQKAQATTNQFQQSAQQAGKGTEAAFKSAGQSIETLNAKLLSLKDRIVKSSDPKVVARLSEQYKILEKQVKAANDEAFKTPKALNETGKATQSLTGQLGGLYTAVKLAFTAGIIKEAVSTTLELAKLSGNVEGVKRAFERAFPDSEALLFRLRKATHNTVTEFDLMQRTLQATNLGVAVEQLPILFEFAAARAQQTGESVDYLVDSIVRGIGRKSILVLDNLGLSATRLKEQFNGASLASQSVADVTKGVAEIAKVELQKMGGYAETSATQVDQLTASFTKLRIELSQSVSSSSFISFIKGYVDSFGLLLEARRNGNTVTEQSEQNLRKEAAQFTASEFTARNLTKSKEENNKVLKEEIALLTKEIGQWTAFRDIQEESILTLKEDAEAVKDDLKQRKISYNEASTQIQRIKDEIKFKETLRDANKEDALLRQELLKIYIAQFNAANKVNVTEEKQLGIIEKLQADIETLGDKIKSATTVDDIEKFNRELVVLETRLKELNDLGKTFTNPLASATFDIKDKLAKGKVKLNTSDLVDTQALEADTTRLFNELGKKAGEEFVLGTADGMTELQRVFAQAQQDLLNAGIDITANALIGLANVEADNYTVRIRQLHAFYDEQEALAGDNQRAKEQFQLREKKQTDKLRKEQAQKEKQAAIFSIIVNTAASIAKTAAALPYPANLPGIIAAAAEGAAQLLVATKANPGFKEGVLNLNGPGNGKSDSINARLSKGESVMTAQEWQTSKNVLKEVRAKRLDDDVLASLKLGNEGVKVIGGMDDKRMIAKLDEIKNSMPDVEARGHLLYTTKKKADNYRMWVRKSSMSE